MKNWTIWKTFLAVMIGVTAIAILATIGFVVFVPDAVTTTIIPASTVEHHSRNDAAVGLAFFAFMLTLVTTLIAFLVSDGEKERRNW